MSFKKKSLARLVMVPTVAMMLSANTVGAVAQSFGGFGFPGPIPFQFRPYPYPVGPFHPAPSARTKTPIKHVVVLFQENVSFDHYFGTYPKAANKAGEQPFTASPGTPTVNGLSPTLLAANQNTNKSGVVINPQRLGPADAYTCSQSHNYGPEQQAVDSGLLDNFPRGTAGSGEGCAADGSTVLGYYDGNTVAAFWRYAQNFSLSDNSFGSTFGPSTVGAINLVSGQTGGAIAHNTNPAATPGGSAYPSNVPVGATGTPVTLIGDFDAYLDDCGGDQGGTASSTTLEFTGQNVGDLLNAKGVTWGWFQGGFRATGTEKDSNGNPVLAADGKPVAVCGDSRAAHQYPSAKTSANPAYVVPQPTINPGSDVHTATADYVSHHEPFQFYKSTRNPHHLPPSSVSAIGSTDQANHQYDTRDFFDALKGGHLPAVSFIKAPAAYNGHPGNSDPVAEQYWVTQVINAIQQSPEWASTAIVIAYDDSDGWYDHVTGPIVNPSATSADYYAGAGNCGKPAAGYTPARCGFGPRLPLLVISPWANPNYVDHTLTNQASILKFVEDNWNLGYIDGPTAPAVGTGSFDRVSGSIEGMFNFQAPPSLRPVLLTCSGNYARSQYDACKLDPTP